MKIAHFILSAFLCAVATSAYAQSQVPNHSVPIGRGGGVSGYGNAAPGTAGQPLVSNGPTLDPSFQAVPTGTGFPTPTRAGDVAYWNGTTWVTLPGNNLGVGFWTESALGVPVYLGCAAANTVMHGGTLPACTALVGADLPNPSASTLGGVQSVVAVAHQWINSISTSGVPSQSQPAVADLSNLGANVATALTLPLSSSGGLATTVASGTTLLGTSAISSATCAAAVVATALTVTTTDTVTASFNGDPTAVTGYIPSTAGMLTIIPYPTANNVNFKVCNNTNGSVTPGAITVNWRVAR